MNSVAAQLAGIIADAIAADTTLKAWVIAQFGSSSVLTVQEGEDAANPPGIDDCPLVIIVPSASNYSVPFEPNDSTVGLRVIAAITNTGKADTTTSGVRRITYANMQQLEAFASKIVTLCNSATTWAQVIRASLDIGGAASFPMVQADIELQFLINGENNYEAYVQATTTTTTTT